MIKTLPQICIALCDFQTAFTPIISFGILSTLRKRTFSIKEKKKFHRGEKIFLNTCGKSGFLKPGIEPPFLRALTRGPLHNPAQRWVSSLVSKLPGLSSITIFWNRKRKCFGQQPISKIHFSPKYYIGSPWSDLNKELVAIISLDL